MHYLIYISTAVNLLTDEELKEILISSRKNNSAKNISGLLLYADGVFLQLLEGEKIDVEQTYKKIENDLRHKKITILVKGEHDNRAFPDWSMGYSVANKAFVDKMEGYINTSKPGALNLNDEHPAINVLKTFAENANISV